MASRTPDEDLGVEVVIEPDVQPAGTVDLRALPARGLGAARRAAPSAAPSAAMFRPQPAAAPASEPAGDDAEDQDQDRASTAIDAAIARDALARAKRAAASAPSTRVDESAIYPAPTVPPSGFPPAPSLPPLEESADIAAVEAAAEAPIPPRPAAASSKEPAPRYAPRDAHEELIPDLGEPSAAGAVVRLVAWLLFLTLLVVGLYAHLMGAAPWQTTLAAKPPVSETAGPATETAAPTTATVLTPVPGTETKPAVTEAPAPVTEAPVEKGPTPEEALAALRSAAQGAAIGADVGAEPEYSGKVEAMQLASAEQLRADAARLIGAGSLADAAKVLEELVALLPDDAEARFKLGLVRHRQGDFAAAEASYRAAAERAPNDPRPLNNLGLVLSAKGDPTGAKGAFEQALALAPEHPDVLSNLGGLVERESPQGAHPLYDKALGVAPNHGPARIGRARVRMALGDRDGAASDFSSLVEQGGPLAVRGLDGLGLVARDAGKAADAEACFRRALEREPTDVGARVNLGVALTDQGKLTDAIRELEAATKAAPQSARAWQALGVARTRAAADDPQLLYSAKEAYERSLKLDDRDWATHFDYGVCAEQFGNFLFAMREYERAMALKPTAWQPYVNLARCYERGNDRQKAIAILERGLRADAKVADLHYELAVLLAKDRRDDEARSSLRRFVDLAASNDPRLTAAREGL